MSKEKTQIEKTAAETKSIGFDYQYYFFLWKLLSLNIGETIGLEVKDDVHIEFNNENQIFYQIKHTIQKKKDGSPINLTTSDIDLWKTLSNWVKVISDPHDNRDQVKHQLIFLNRTSFILATNKSSSEKNIILEGIIDLQSNDISFPDIKKIFETFLDQSNDKNISNYVKDVLNLEDEVLNRFLLQVFFELDEDDIIQKCKDAIKADKISENNIDELYANLDSAIRTDNFINIRSGMKVIISFNQFYKKYRRYYDLARNTLLNIIEFNEQLPDKLEDQIFIKQLLEIEDIELDDIEEIAEFTRFKLKLFVA